LAENINFSLKQKWITNYCNFVRGGKNKNPVRPWWKKQKWIGFLANIPSAQI